MSYIWQYTLENSTCPVVLTENHVIFGLYYDLTHFSAINYIILLGKMYIYRQKLKENNIYFKYFLNELKSKLVIEKTICETNNTLTQFNKKWTHFNFLISDSSNQIVLICPCFVTNQRVYLSCLSVFKITLCHQRL